MQIAEAKESAGLSCTLPGWETRMRKPYWFPITCFILFPRPTTLLCIKQHRLHICLYINSGVLVCECHSLICILNPIVIFRRFWWFLCHHAHLWLSYIKTVLLHALSDFSVEIGNGVLSNQILLGLNAIYYMCANNSFCSARKDSKPLICKPSSASIGRGRQSFFYSKCRIVEIEPSS